MKRLMIGGAALVRLCSSRSTNDVDFLINDTTSKDPFIFDKENNIDYCNANGNDFFKLVYNSETNNNSGIASPQALLELKAYAFVQHCQNFNFQKADDCEYDIKFLVRNFDVNTIKIANKFISEAELKEVNKLINSTKK